MGALLDEAAVVEHEHAVGPLGGRQAVGDRDRRPARATATRGRGRCGSRCRGRPPTWPRRAAGTSGWRRRPGPATTSWRSPTDSALAPLADLGRRARGAACRATRRGRARRRRAGRRPRVAFGLAKRTFVEDRRRRTGTPSCGTSTSFDRSDAERAPSRRSMPCTVIRAARSDRPAARAAWRASTCPSRSRRRGRPTRRRGSTASTSRSAYGRRPGSGTTRPRRGSPAGRRAASSPSGPGSATSIGVSSTSSTLRQPATAVWVWSRISVNSAIGSRNSATRNRNATISPAVRPAVGPDGDAGEHDGRHREDGEHLVGREQARRRASRPARRRRGGRRWPR